MLHPLITLNHSSSFQISISIATGTYDFPNPNRGKIPLRDALDSVAGKNTLIKETYEKSVFYSCTLVTVYEFHALHEAKA